jgi:RNA polymerase sigma factor (sigma-70 family)
MSINFEAIEQLSKQYVELKQQLYDENERIFNANFLNRIKKVLQEKCNKNNALTISYICSELDLDPSFKDIIRLLIKSEIIPGFKLIRGRNGGIAKVKNAPNDIKEEFKNCQNKCINAIKPLVLSRVGKYKRFSNYEDLKQDGFEAVILALETYDPNKGSFIWWADHYIKTKVSRSANMHSTIRIPLKKAKERAPHKETTMPILVNFTFNPCREAQDKENTIEISEAISVLPPENKKLIELTFGFNNIDEKNIQGIMQDMNLTYPQYVRILNESKRMIKRYLADKERV